VVIGCARAEIEDVERELQEAQSVLDAQKREMRS
jgi:hypothetical protein